MAFWREIMAFLCLGIVLVNTILITLDVGGWFWSLARFRARLSAFGGEGLFRGQLRSRSGDFPRFELVLVGHGRGEGKVFFHGRNPRPIFPDGVQLTSLENPSGPPLLLEPNGESWIWPDEKALERELACPSPDDFDDFAPRTERGKGAERTIGVEFDETQSIYVFGTRDEIRGSIGPAPLNLDPEGLPRLILAAFDPRAWALSKMGQISLVLIAIWATFASLVWLCFQGPAFGFWSQVGALGLLGFFLLVQPLGVFLREKTALPHEVPRAPVWKRPARTSFARSDDPAASAHSFPANSP